MILTMIGQPTAFTMFGFLFLVYSLNAAHSEKTDINTKKPTTSAITYNEYTGGRFGDKLMMYMRTKMLAHKLGLPFLYKPFVYSNQLVMDKEETHFKYSDYKKFKNVVEIIDKKLDIQRDSETLYVVNYYADLHSLYGIPYGMYQYNETLGQEIAHMIKPVNHLEKIFRPDDQITVAIHVRTGGGFDKTSFAQQDAAWAKKNDYSADQTYPRKFPPFEFYIDQLKELAVMAKNKPLYVHIFTDDKNPQNLLETFKEALKDLPITFATRLSNNAHDANVLEDFFAMAEFDCLIRPYSSFSIMAEQIGSHKMVMSPHWYHWEDNNKLVIDKAYVRKAQNWQKMIKVA